jgi:hypothetical protein
VTEVPVVDVCVTLVALVVPEVCEALVALTLVSLTVTEEPVVVVRD